MIQKIKIGACIVLNYFKMLELYFVYFAFPVISILFLIVVFVEAKNGHRAMEDFRRLYFIFLTINCALQILIWPFSDYLKYFTIMSELTLAVIVYSFTN